MNTHTIESLLELKAEAQNNLHHIRCQTKNIALDSLEEDEDFEDIVVEYRELTKELKTDEKRWTKFLSKIDAVLRSCCAHEWTTDTIELPDGRMQDIEYCRCCELNRE